MEYTYNKYKLTTNEGGFIIGFMAVLGDEYDWIGQPAEVEANNNGISMAYGCYKLIDGEMAIDEGEYERLKAIEEERKREQEKEAQRIPAQVVYTALLTNTLIGGDE